MGGRGSSNARGGFGNEPIPSELDVRMGGASYIGLPVVYDGGMSAEARNHDTYIAVSDKFFAKSGEEQRSILNHEVAHGLSDEMISENSTGDFQKFSSAFVKQKQVPKGSTAWQRGQRTYSEGIYGDIGATALVETTTRAITEYLSSPSSLKRKSPKAYRYVSKFMRGR